MGVHHHKAPIVTDGLVFHVDAANKVSSTEAPSSATNNILDPSLSGIFAAQAIVQDGEYKFDGTDDRIDFGNDGSWESPESTIEAWIYPTVGTRSIYERGYSINTLHYGLIQILNDQHFLCTMRKNGSTRSWKSSITVPYNQWSNVLVTKTETNKTVLASNYGVKMYIDGIEDTGVTLLNDAAGDGVDQWLDTISPLNKASIGTHYNPGPINFWKGSIGSIKIYDRDLSAEEIKQNYESQKHRFE